MSEEEILSQDEVNALTGKDDGASAREELYDGNPIAYDFKQPEHTKQSHFPTLQIINEKTALNLKDKIEFMLQQKVEVNAQEITINKYGEFVNSLNIPIDIKRIRIPQLKGSFLVCFDDQLVNAIIEEYFGAPAALPSSKSRVEQKDQETASQESDDDEDQEQAEEQAEEQTKDEQEQEDDVFDDDVAEDDAVFLEKEEFTNAESRISQKLLSYLLDSMQDGWLLLDNYSFEHEQTEKNPRLINYIDHDELIVNINFEIEIREKTTVIRIGVPYKMLDKVKHQLRRVVQTNTEAGDKKWQLKLYKKLQTVPVEVVGELGRVTLPVNKLVQLKVGDVIGLPKPEHITLYANKTPVMQGNIGESNGQTAIQINSWIKANKQEP